MVDSCTVKKIKPINVADFEGIEFIMKALSNKIRLAILEALIENGELCACELEISINLPQPTITLNLQRLYYSGLLKRREQAKYTYFSIKEEFIPLIKNILNIQTSAESMG
ncbi:MAG: ArsR/SmtB family transcription factor [Nitrososphaeria archaeon]